ncbi:ribosome silencing factor [Nitriliruptor alkaliphilus]|uniref:ribosome silencing factor n=1 Tax=Nitriliruptor alkaliphilus TaxID=427918 RepID=UPI0009FA747F|nr:ribosome silencing factor [Nitriliruptor alkaliphilus]
MPATDEAVALAVTAADAADDRKATDLAILEVADILAVVDLFLLATAASDRQLKAVADRIEERLHEDHGREVLRREGTPGSGWMLLDFGDLVCQLFAEEQRDYYALDRLWADVPRRDVLTGERSAAPEPGAGSAREADVEGGRVPNPFDVELTGEDDDDLQADAEVADLAAELDDLDTDLADDLHADGEAGAAGDR